MWEFTQDKGEIFDPTGKLLVIGYSGAWDGSLPVGGPNDHRNKPADQELHALGPIPVGVYTIGASFDDVGGKGPLAMHLTPHPDNVMYGRSEFLIHGDLSPPKSGQASEGCIILDHIARQAISDSDDRILVVLIF